MTEWANRDEDRIAALFARLPGDETARDELVQTFAPLAKTAARRFRGRAEEEDLVQVAMLALLKAVDRFDPERGVPFSAYATTSIVGELKRHLRDTAWAMRVPRQLQEASLAVGRALDDLTQRSGRSPTIAELGQVTGLSDDEVLDALEAGSAYQVGSLDAPQPGEDGPPIEPSVDDDAFERMDEWASVADELRALPERERRILQLRFFRDMSQSQIAAELGISQMHVSRILARTLAQLRSSVADEVGPST